MHEPSGFRARFVGEPPATSPAQRFAAACDLHDLAIELIAARVRREKPHATEDDVHSAVAAWLAGGDLGPGRVRS